jgi:subtilisin family serine protease
MKRSFSFLVLVFFCLNILTPGIQVYADSQKELTGAVTAWVQLLDKLSDTATNKLEGIEKTSNTAEQKERTREKQQEIETYVEQVQTSLKDDANSTKEVNTLLLEAKKTIALKVVSWATKYDDLLETISKDIAKTQEKRDEAEQVLEDSLQTDNAYWVLVETTYSQAKVQNLITPFDPKVQVSLMYTSKGENTFELTVDKKSIFAREILSEIEDGNIPENLLGIHVIKPELFTINTLEWEDTTSTWGIKKYNVSEYLPTLPSQSKIQVGVIDTGIDTHHSDLASHISSTLGYDFVNNDSDAVMIKDMEPM